MKKCLNCQKSGFSDSQTRCPHCNTLLVTDASTLFTTSRPSSNAAPRRPVMTDDPVTSSRPTASSAHRPGPTGGFEPARSGGSTYNAHPQPQQPVRRHDLDRSMPLILRVLGVLLALGLIAAGIALIVTHLNEIRQFFSVFFLGALAGLFVFIFFARGHLNPRWILGFCGIFGILAIILAYNLFNIGGSIRAMVNAILPTAILCFAIYLILRSIFPRR